MLALSQEQTSVTTFYSPTGDVSGVPVATQFLLKRQDLRLPRFALTSVAAEKKLNQGDGIHPTAEGVDLIVKNMLPTVEAFLRTIAGQRS